MPKRRGFPDLCELSTISALSIFGCGDSEGLGGSTTSFATTSATTASVQTSTSGSPSSSSTGLPATFVVRGVVTDGTLPVEGAIVMQGGGQPELITGPDGQFELELTNAISGQPTVVAAKIGYRSDGLEFFEVPLDPVVLVLYQAGLTDNQGYVFGDPGTGNPLTDNSTKYCGHCHTTYVQDFLQSAHARSAKNPRVQDIYAGVGANISEAACAQRGGEWKSGLLPGSVNTSMSKCYLGEGVLPDLNPCGGAGSPACDDPTLAEPNKPVKFGACADCHAIGIDGKAGGRNLHEATGLAFDKGNHCDTCHHVREVDLTKPAGNAGALVMGRPLEKIGPDFDAPLRQIMYGPYPDVPTTFMGGSYQPQFDEASFCAGCHHLDQTALMPGDTLDNLKWPKGLPIHGTFDEWSGSFWQLNDTPCQRCHMPEKLGLTNAVDVTTPPDASISAGFVRDSKDLHAHTFRGPLSVTDGQRFIDTAAALSVSAMRVGNDLEVAVTVENVGAGHALPTGEPLRALLLLVSVSGCNVDFAANGGQTIADLGGAHVRGIVGSDVSVNGSTLTFGSPAASVKVGDVVRAARPTGVYDDYVGIGYFANPALSAQQKGIELVAPVGAAVVTAVDGNNVTIAAALPLQVGDRIYVGAATDGLSDGASVTALAGASGAMFHKVLLDRLGSRGVLHHQALDIASDNRIAPKSSAISAHSFAIAAGCNSAMVSAQLVYRPIPHHVADRFGWDAKDYVIQQAAIPVVLAN